MSLWASIRPGVRLGVLAALLLGAGRPACAQQVLYGGNEWLQYYSVNTGWLVTVDTQTAVTTLIGRPAGVERISGLAFDAAGTLWATSITGTESGTNRTSMLLKLDPSDGSLLETIGPVLDGAGGPPIAIESLAFQPGTGALFGSRGIADLGRFNRGDVYRLDAATGVASLFADNDDNYGLDTVVFAPDGTMYQAAATYPNHPGGSPKLQTLDPSTGAILTSLPTERFYKALAVRDDGALFGASSVDNMASSVDDFFRIDPATGIPTFIGQTGDNPIGSLAFGPEVGPCEAEDCPGGTRSEVLRPAEPRPATRVVVRPSP